MRHIDINGFFLAIGHHPNTTLFKDFIALDAEGYIITDGHSTQCFVAEQSTICNQQLLPLPGVFAAGDCADPHYRQAIVAAGSGAKAAIEADKYLKSL
jgi:thioredoxin reductase (NADPH)